MVSVFLLRQKHHFYFRNDQDLVRGLDEEKNVVCLETETCRLKRVTLFKLSLLLKIHLQNMQTLQLN